MFGPPRHRSRHRSPPARRRQDLRTAWQGDTHGIFQLEASSKPNLLDINPSASRTSGCGGLNRPGPIEGGATGTWMRRKRGEEPVTYMLPTRADPQGKRTARFSTRPGDEDASAVAGFTLGKRHPARAMARRTKVKMSSSATVPERSAGTRRRQRTPVQLFRVIASRRYGFNGAHSISYGLIAYRPVPQGDFARVHVPRATTAGGQLDKLKQSILDAHARGLASAPDVNASRSGLQPRR